MKQIAEAGKALLTEYTAKLVSGQTGEEYSGADDDLLDDRPAGAGQVHEVRIVRARQPSSLGLPGGIHGSAIVEPELDHRIPGGIASPVRRDEVLDVAADARDRHGERPMGLLEVAPELLARPVGSTVTNDDEFGHGVILRAARPSWSSRAAGLPREAFACAKIAAGAIALPNKLSFDVVFILR
jgi:hypothetical protein